MDRWGIWLLKDSGVAFRCPLGEFRLYLRIEWERHGPIKWRQVDSPKKPFNQEPGYVDIVNSDAPKPASIMRGP